jgi:hypothetical protein
MECLLRVHSARAVLEAVLVGDWPLDDDVFRQLHRLLAAAARWHDRAIALGLAA